MELLNNNFNQIYLQIVMDIGYPMSVDNLQNILNALNNALAVGYSIRNSKETAFFFGFSSMNDIFQSIAPFEEKRNFSTTWSILKDLQNMIRSKVQITMEDYEDLLHLALKSAVEEYSSKQKSRGRFDKKSSMEILIITRKYAHNFNSCIERISKNLNVNQLKRIQILKLIDDDSEVEGGEEEEESENEKSSLVNNIKAKLDSEIDDHIKRCIFASYRNLGEMILYMPNKTIYCELSFYNISSRTCKLDLSKVQKMEVVNRIAADGLCESHIFGDPIRVTSSNKMENWMQQVVNRQTFKALCRHLNESDEYLIVRLKNAVSLSTYDYFALRPGADSMLMKSVCSGEMALPATLSIISTDEEMSIQEYAEVGFALRHVARAEEYLPNHFLAGLVPSLLSEPVASAKRGSALIKRNQYNKLEVQLKKMSYHQQVDGESPTIINSQGENGEPASKRRMLLPLDTHLALLNTDTTEDIE
ncbi:hypothetical protein LSTR_LSTR002548 [Laodelphax striatellus]|uniref:Uncharacterized protein n=1 Tax=Laodelphax striatellus TaxID=195883 RepID=A0A482XKS2_LAOST|nr:hypothetical protein LSTR_LSTR002548 [Laodelphax striatellus]